MGTSLVLVWFHFSEEFFFEAFVSLKDKRLGKSLYSPLFSHRNTHVSKTHSHECNFFGVSSGLVPFPAFMWPYLPACDVFCDTKLIKLQRHRRLGSLRRCCVPIFPLVMQQQACLTKVSGDVQDNIEAVERWSLETGYMYI